MRSPRRAAPTVENAEPAAPSRERDWLRIAALIGAILSVPVGLLGVVEGMSIADSSFPNGLGGGIGDEERAASSWLIAAGLAIAASAVAVAVALVKRSHEITVWTAVVQAAFALVAVYWTHVADSLPEHWEGRGNAIAWYGNYGVALLSAALALAWAARGWSKGSSGQVRRA